MALEYQRDEHRVHRIVSHLVRTPKRRQPVLTGAIAAACRQLIQTKCDEQGWTILDLAMQPDQLQLVVQAWPTVSAADIVKAGKGLTSHELRQRFPVLKRLPSLWTRSCLAATAGQVARDVIQRHLAAQQGR